MCGDVFKGDRNLRIGAANHTQYNVQFLCSMCEKCFFIKDNRKKVFVLYVCHSVFQFKRMALPHLSARTYATRKNIYEAAIVHRRNHENNYREQWDNNAKYFNSYNVLASKQNAWESDLSFQHR